MQFKLKKLSVLQLKCAKVYALVWDVCLITAYTNTYRALKGFVLYAHWGSGILIKVCVLESSENEVLLK